MRFFKSGSANLDLLLHGGYPSGTLSAILGEVGVGRTALGLAASGATTRQKKNVLFFDCEGSLSAERAHELNLDHFSPLRPENLEGCLDATLQWVRVKGAGLAVLDSPNLLLSRRGSIASVAGMFTNWVPKVKEALRDNPNKAVLLTWQVTRGSRKNARLPVALSHGVDTTLVLSKHEEGVEVTVTKDRRGEADCPSCIIQFNRWRIQDVRIVSAPIDRNAIPLRFDRGEII